MYLIRTSSGYLNVDNIISAYFNDADNFAAITTTGTDGQQHYENGPVYPSPLRLEYHGEEARTIHAALDDLYRTLTGQLPTEISSNDTYTIAMMFQSWEYIRRTSRIPAAEEAANFNKVAAAFARAYNAG